MRKLVAVLAMVAAAFFTTMSFAADLPQYPVYEVPELPPVDYGLGGNFYLRGSAAFGVLTAMKARYGCDCETDIDEAGYGYSLGAGFGYETGTGLRADVTFDYLYNDGMQDEGGYELTMRSGLGLVNVYYDFGFGDPCCSAAGGFGGYVGAGIGAAYNHVDVTSTPSGSSVEPALALMTGVTYDMGAIVADLGYRMIYQNKLTNETSNPFYIDDAFTHEVRGTLRYRFN